MCHLKILFLCVVIVGFSSQPIECRRSYHHLKRWLRDSATVPSYPSSGFDSLVCSRGGRRYRGFCYRWHSVKMTYFQAENYRRRYGLQFASLRSYIFRREIRRIFWREIGSGYVFLFRMYSRIQRIICRRYYYQRYRRGYIIVMDIRSGRIFSVPSYRSIYFIMQRRACRRGYWLCRDHSRCLKPKYLCNGRRECRDGSDEKLEQCRRCGGQVNETSAKIESPNFPKKYPNNAYCDWTVFFEGASAILVKFEEWKLQKYDNDYLRITDDRQTRTFKGEHKMKNREVKFSGSFLRIIFRSDKCRNDKGFIISFKKETRRNRVYNVTTPVVHGIAPDAFQTGLNLLFIYYSPMPLISYVFTEFYVDPECTFTFRDGASGRDEVLKTVTGGAPLGSYSIFLKTKTLKVQLVCGASFRIRPSDFRFRVRVSMGCVTVFDRVPSGEFLSPTDQNGRYPKGVTCEYRFTRLYEFTRFYIERFDVIGPDAYLRFNGTKYWIGERLQADMDNLEVRSGDNLNLTFVAKETATQAKGFKIHFSKACNVRGTILQFNKEMTVRAESNKVFDDQFGTKTEKKVKCLKGGILSTSLKTYLKRCRAGWFSHSILDQLLGRIYDLGDYVDYSCPLGRRPVGRTRYLCTIGGWVQQGSCEKIACSREGLADNLKVTVFPDFGDNIIHPVSIVTFDCKDPTRFRLQGNSINYCTSSGTFMYPLPRCVAKGCIVPHWTGRREYWEKEGQEMKVGESSAMKCRGSYQPANPNTKLVCYSPGRVRIENGPAECRSADTCKSTRPCGIHECRNLPGSYECICKEGYRSSADRKTCIDINECKERTLPFGCHACHNTPGDFYCTCRPGFQIYTEALRSFAQKYYKYHFQRNLIKVNKSCLARKCPDVAVPNSRPISEKSAYFTNDKYFYRCNPGYEADGMFMNNITCAPTATSVAWTGTQACRLGQCPAEYMVPNGGLVITNRDFSATAKLRCDDGYATDKDNTTFRCTQHYVTRSRVYFRWTGQAKCIEVKRCLSLSNPSNGRVTINNGISWYKCNNGFILQGNPFRYCNDGKWSGVAPTCIRPTCERLDISGRNVVAYPNSTTDRIWFRCRAAGYNMTGDASLQCQLGDRWLEMKDLKWKTSYFCDNTIRQIGCPAGKVIHPVYAVYGYEFRKVNSCAAGDSYPEKACGNATLSLNFVNSICKNHRTCWIPVKAEMFNTSQTGICEGKTRILEVTYVCAAKRQTVTSSHALLSCDNVVEGLMETILDPRTTSANLTKYENGSSICNEITKEHILGCMAFKEKVIRPDNELFKYYLYRSIVTNLCRGNQTEGSSACLRCFDISKQERSSDLCSPNLKTCLLKTCWTTNPMNTLFKKYSEKSCNLDQFIKKNASLNLLLNEKYAPTEHNGVKLRHYYYKAKWGDWDTIKQSVDLAEKPLILPSKETKLQFKFLTTIHVRSIYMQLSVSGQIGQLQLFTAVSGTSSTLRRTNFEMRRVRGDVIQIVPDPTVSTFDEFIVEFSVENVIYDISHLRMSVSYEKPDEALFADEQEIGPAAFASHGDVELIASPLGDDATLDDSDADDVSEPVTRLSAVWVGKVPRCFDVEKPKPRGKNDCRSPRIFNETGEPPLRHPISLATIWPSFTDNSGERVTVSVVNATNLTRYSQVSFDEWEKDLIFNATDTSGNSFFCTVTLRWKDVTKPVVKCPNVNYVQTSLVSSNKAAIVLPSVAASDANGIQSIEYSVKNGTLVSVGFPHEIRITVTDNGNNTVICRYYHTITPSDCNKDAFPYESRKNMTVDVANNGIFTLVKVTCDVGFSLGHTFHQEEQLTCSKGKLTFPLSLEGSQVIPPCLETNGVYSVRYQVIIRNKIRKHCCDAGFTVNNMTQLLASEVDCLNAVSSKLSVQLTTKSSVIQESQACTLDLAIGFTYEYTITNGTHLSLCGDQIVKTLRDKMFTLSPRNASCTQKDVTIVVDPVSQNETCEPGCVSKKRGVLLCVPCYKGTFHNATANTCDVCDFDSFQDETQQTACKRCPPDTGTLEKNARNITMCLPKCQKGHFKKDGRPIEPCDVCPVGSYSNTVGASECKACPASTTTAGPGSKSIMACLSRCSPGYYSTNGGLSPCYPCPKDSYQNGTGQMTCIACPANTGTRGVASTSRADCVDIDPCADHSCVNGTCKPQPSFQYSCECETGFTGRFCERIIDLCKEGPCQFGTCAPSLNNYTCTCNPGYKGRNCSKIDYCYFDPCKHNSTCVNRNSTYVCKNCEPPHTGRNCDEFIDPCLVEPCKNKGVCIRDGNSTSYSCNCTRLYEGPNCEIKKDFCSPNPCQNGGVCDNSTEGAYSCKCPSGWKGTNCETDIDECTESASNPCVNDGTCINTDGSYECECKPGYEGRNCSHEIDECLSNPCKNNATCVNGIANFTCICPPGYEGLTCEEEINLCLSNPCDVNGTLECEPKINNFTCKCANNYEGRFCNITTKYCEPNPCWNNVECVEGPDVQNIYNRSADTKFHCVCPDYRGGDRCEIQLDTCRNHKCLNGATCVNGTTNYTCVCPRGYNGTHCENPVDLCELESPCANGGVCTPTAGNYTCQCKTGWTGRNCSEQTNECLNKPCLNGGTCIPSFNNYICICTREYEGKNCSKKVDMCETRPCQNGGTCFSSATASEGYECLCPSGFNGTDCENNIDDCPVPSPCENGGVCKDLVDDFVCICPSRIFEGKLCNFIKSEDYDYLFEKLSTPPVVRQFVSVNESMTSMSIAFWVRSFVAQHPVHLRISLEDAEILDFSTDQLRLRGDSSKSLSLSGISAGEWVHFLFNFESRNVKFYVNGRSAGNLTSAVSQFEPGNYSVDFGNPNNSTDFRGQISRFYWRNVALNASEIEKFALNCSSLEAPAVSPDIILDWRMIASGTNNSRDSQCGLSACPPGSVGSSCGGEEDNEPPIVVYCPTEGVTVVNNTDLAAIHFREPEFYDKHDGEVTNITKSHESGVILRPGIYEVVWRAYDKAGNEAVCSFQLSFVKYKCEKQDAPDNNTAVVCTETGDDVYCQVYCKDTTRYKLPPGVFGFYSCSPAADGWQPKQEGTFKVAGCVLSVPPTSSATGELEIILAEGDKCENKKETITKQFIRLMTQIRMGQPKICAKVDCSDLRAKLQISCGGARRRRRRAAGGVKVTYTLPGGDVAANAMCKEVQANATLGGGEGVVLTAGACPSVVSGCANGFILDDDGSCSACPAGTFHSTPYDTTCTPCPKSTYSDSSGATKCQACPETQTTPGVGAASQDICYDICAPGKFLSTATGACMLCPAGSYQPAEGQAECLACGPAQASSPGSVKCLNCSAGQQLDASGQCSPCPKGFYRPDDTNQPNCVACPVGSTTAGTGATAVTQCLVICSAGEFRNDDSICEKCPLGTYQPSEGQTKCLSCGVGKTTKSPGATAETACIPGEVDECKVGSHNCHKHADCINTPGSFKCICKKPNWQGDGVQCACAEGYGGDLCDVETKPSGLTKAELIGVIFGCVLAAVLIIAVGFAVYYKKVKLSQSSKWRQGKYEVYSNPSYDVSPRPVELHGVTNSSFEPIALHEMPGTRP